MVSDRDAIATAVAAAIAANPQAVEDLKKGKKKPEAVKGFLRGQVMKQTGGKANPALVGELLESKLAEILSGYVACHCPIHRPPSGGRIPPNQSPDARESGPAATAHAARASRGLSSQRNRGEKRCPPGRARS